MSNSAKVTFYSVSGEAVAFEDPDPDFGLVSVSLNPSISVAEDSPEMDVLLKREETGWVTRSKPSTKKDADE